MVSKRPSGNWGVAGIAVVLLLVLSMRADPSNTHFHRAVSSQIPNLRQHYSLPVGQWPAPWLDPQISFVEFRIPPDLSKDATVRQWADLGRQLFHDPILSANGRLTCASCHAERFGWSTNGAVGIGANGQQGRRNPPSLFTSAREKHLTWDGRGSSLESQSLVPLTLADEMGNLDVEAVLQRLRAKPPYASEFAMLNGGHAIAAADLARSLISFQATLDMPTRFDDFLAGNHQVMNDTEIWGLHLFRTKARCANCHFGAMLTDGRYHNLKISFYGAKSQDLGRYEVTSDPEDVGLFRTPSLRHVSKSPPYMHNGLFRSLEGVINLYDRGGGEVWARNRSEAAKPLYRFAARLSTHIRPLGLSEQKKAALAAFLRAL